MTTSPMRSARACRAIVEMPESVTSTLASCRRAMRESPTMPHFVWSATTTSRPAAATIARFVSASMRFGVVNPADVSMPWTPMKSRSTCRSWSAATATGPTRASDTVRRPPVSSTVWPRSASKNTLATGIELVTTVMSGTWVRWRASV